MYSNKCLALGGNDPLGLDESVRALRTRFVVPPFFAAYDTSSVLAMRIGAASRDLMPSLSLTAHRR